MADEKPLRPFITYSACVFAIGLLTLLLTVLAAPIALNVPLLLLIAAALISETYALKLRSFTISLAFPLIIAAMVTSGPAGAGLVATASFTNLSEIRDRRPFSALAFNFGQLAISGCIGGWAYEYVASAFQLSRGGTLQAAQVPGALAAVLAAAAVFAATNLLLIATGVRIGKGIPFRRVIRDFAEYLPTQIALAVVGLLIAETIAVSPVAFPAFLFPLLLARQVYQHYSELRDAYSDTVRSLIGALEAKDPYTSGHSERVAEYATALADALGYPEHLVDVVRQSALLHDIGKLSLPTRILAKPGGLTEDEFLEIKRHPWVGGEMVNRIPALRPLAEFIRVHHERIDGRGYPTGLKGSEIPQIGRLLALADAYDAMTTDRAYRPAMTHECAVGELINGCDSQFDRQLVELFVRSGIGSHAIQTPLVVVAAGVSAHPAGSEA